MQNIPGADFPTNNPGDTDNETDLDEGYADRYEEFEFAKNVSHSDPDGVEALRALLKGAVGSRVVATLLTS